MVLISMEKESILNEHHADGTISMQVLKGAIRFIAQEKAYELRANNVVTLAASIKHKMKRSVCGVHPEYRLMWRPSLVSAPNTCSVS